MPGHPFGPVRAPAAEQLSEARKAVESAAAEVKELTASVNRVMGGLEDTQLELVMPEPLVENIALQDVSDQRAAANPEVADAEQTLVKARAAAAIPKLAYVPTVAAVIGSCFRTLSWLCRATSGTALSSHPTTSISASASTP